MALVVAGGAAVASVGLWAYNKLIGGTNDLELTGQIELARYHTRQTELEISRLQWKMQDKENEMKSKYIAFFSVIAALTFIALLVVVVYRLLSKWFDKLRHERTIEHQKCQSEADERQLQTKASIDELRIKTALEQHKLKLDMLKESSKKKELQLSARRTAQHRQQLSDTRLKYV